MTWWDYQRYLLNGAKIMNKPENNNRITITFTDSLGEPLENRMQEDLVAYEACSNCITPQKTR